MTCCQEVSQGSNLGCYWIAKRNTRRERANGSETIVAAKTILIVDDDLSFAQFLADVLLGAGYDPVVARSGARAFAGLEVTRPALMLVDVFMPVIDGITFCRMARANPTTRDTPILVMSAMLDLRQIIPVPISGFLTKPIDIDELLRLAALLVEEPDLHERTA